MLKDPHQRLAGLHPDLVRVAERAGVIAVAGDLVLLVLEGLRTPERQKQLYLANATRTLNSRHLTGHAVDLGVLVAGQLRWDWPLYRRLGSIVKTAAAELKVPLTWGGDWKTFKDGPHFELPRSTYPVLPRSE